MALVAAVTFLTAGAVLMSFQSLLFTAISIVIVLTSVASFVFPTHYRLSDRGIEERRLWTRRRRSWSDMRRLQIGGRAALVSPFARPNWLDRYRGFIVLFDGADKEVVVAELERRMQRDRTEDLVHEA